MKVNFERSTPAGDRRWMVVDDDEDILTMMSAVLKGLTDAAVECHASPQSALAAFNEAPDTYELVITDYEMPGMDGVELCRQLRAVSPSQRVFLATGSGFFTGATARRAGFSALLNKPFPPPLLKQALVENSLLNERENFALTSA
ncbi:MAG TPA: response regulator [Candidatus Sulfotelmatobacter sp.]|jgi:two-component system cell cycle sensor histidine kinase/response regulator CckA|nr:response regulator [Candidatus Sulfotelmatobacter sp.]